MNQAVFFEKIAGSQYDETVRFVVPHYDLVHDALLTAIRSLLPQTKPDQQQTIVDIGSGTGIECLRVLKEFPHTRIVAVDIAPSMHEVLVHKAHREIPDVADRLRTVTGDICDADTVRAVNRSLKDIGVEYADAVMSAFTLHNLTNIDKINFLDNAHQLLPPRGLFLNCDLYTYANSSLAKVAHRFDIQFIEASFNDAVSRARRGSPGVEAKLRELRDAWVHHYEFENKLDPLEDIPPARGQIAEWRDAGFSDVSIIFRFLQTALVAGWRR